LRWLHAIADVIGLLASILPIRENRVAARNLELCFKELDARQRRQWRRACLRETARTLFELPWIWGRSRAEVLALIESIEGAELLEMARDEGKGLLIAAPHLGAFELLNLWLSQHLDLLVLYRAPDNPAVDAWLTSGRTRFGARAVRAEGKEIRALVKHLRAGGAVGILPDQQPKRGEGEFANFFGIQAFTMTLFPELVRRYQAPVILAYAERLANGRFCLHLKRAAPAPSDVQLLNAAVESCVRALPTQYQWTYKRFSMRPEGEAKLYR
jgi:KDO2-lipid IV(A) lauroyltransferase